AVADGDCPVSGTCRVADLNEVLLQNSSIGYPTTSSTAKPFKWKGPYLEVGADPWGNPYKVNIINCKSGSTDACFVISAGSNNKIETSFNTPKKSTVTPSGDDIVYRIK